MKKTILSALIFCVGLATYAQSDKYVAAMKKNIAMLDSAMEKGNARDIANNFERIGDAEKNQWLPYYYAAYAQILITYTEQDKSKVDPVADKAEELITKAQAIAGKENSEITVIKSMIATAHMGVDPQSRYMKYGPAALSNIEKAKALDPTNPRPYYLDGQQKFYTPAAFGGGKDLAKILFEKALAMYDTFKPESELHPAWGKSMAQYFLEMANK